MRQTFQNALKLRQLKNLVNTVRLNLNPIFFKQQCLQIKENGTPLQSQQTQYCRTRYFFRVHLIFANHQFWTFCASYFRELVYFPLLSFVDDSFLTYLFSRFFFVKSRNSRKYVARENLVLRIWVKKTHIRGFRFGHIFLMWYTLFYKNQ